jgi:hypothetical protein
MWKESSVLESSRTISSNMLYRAGLACLQINKFLSIVLQLKSIGMLTIPSQPSLRLVSPISTSPLSSTVEHPVDRSAGCSLCFTIGYVYVLVCDFLGACSDKDWPCQLRDTSRSIRDDSSSTAWLCQTDTYSDVQRPAYPMLLVSLPCCHSSLALKLGSPVKAPT